MLHSVGDVSDVVLNEPQFMILDGDELHTVKYILHVRFKERHFPFPLIGRSNVGSGSVGG